VRHLASVGTALETARHRPVSPPGDIEHLPEPAQRYLSHALGKASVLSSGVRLTMTGSVMQGRRRLGLEAVETLVPSRGFLWSARARMGPVVVTVPDHYVDQSSAVEVRLFGLVPLGGERGPDTAASSRGRLAAESVWAPATLAPGPGLTWSAVDGATATANLSIDDVEESVTLTVDEDGGLQELHMQRWGDVGVDRHQRLPYGFRVLAEATFGGLTIPTSLEGGWWYGTERYDAARASRFSVTSARFD
jgi:hypothetical protein